jgi:hypothetical protein
MNQVTQADIDRLSRNLNALEYVMRRGNLGTHNVERMMEDRLTKQIFLNACVISLIFFFAILCCIFEPNMLHFVITLGLSGCIWMASLVNQLGLLILIGNREDG